VNPLTCMSLYPVLVADETLYFRHRITVLPTLVFTSRRAFLYTMVFGNLFGSQILLKCHQAGCDTLGWRVFMVGWRLITQSICSDGGGVV
jgi:hypothetical protein